MKSLNRNFCLGLSCIITFCLVVTCSLYISISANAAGSKIYQFQLRNYLPNDNIRDKWTDVIVTGNDVDFVSLCRFSSTNLEGQYVRAVYLYAFSLDEFELSYSNHYVNAKDEHIYSSSGTSGIRSTTVNDVTVYYTSYYDSVFVDGYSMGIVSGFPNMHYLYPEDGDVDFIQEMAEEFVANGGLNWEDDPSYGDSKTITWNDFFLDNVVFHKNYVSWLKGYYEVSWSGTTRDSDLLTVPDSDTFVAAVIILVDDDGNVFNQTIDTNTIGGGSIHFDVFQIMDHDSGLYWDGMIYLMPTFTKDGDLYMGQYTVIDYSTGDIYQHVIDEENGTIHKELISSGTFNPDDYDFFDSDSLTDYVGTAFSFLSDLYNMMKGFPAFVASIFQFIPKIYITSIGVMLIIIFIARILGR